MIVSFTLDDEQQATLRSGEPLEEAVAALAEYPLAGIAVNCCLPERIGEAVVVLAATDHDIIGAYANAFTRVPADWLLDGDKETDGSLDLRGDLTPALYGRFAREWINAGANLIGGCCGTVAAHTGSLREVIDSLPEPG